MNSTEREVGVEDVEDVTVFIMEHLSFIKNWLLLYKKHFQHSAKKALKGTKQLLSFFKRK